MAIFRKSKGAYWKTDWTWLASTSTVLHTTRIVLKDQYPAAETTTIAGGIDGWRDVLADLWQGRSTHKENPRQAAHFVDWNYRNG
jgi:hypothetical protein